MSYTKKLLAGTALGALLAIGSVGTANATPYAFASTTYNDFLVTLTGDVSVVNGSISVNTSQNYPGSTNTGGTTLRTFSGSNNTTTGAVTAPYAYGGPNASAIAPADASGSTTSPLLESGLKGGLGARAAASVGAASIFTGAGDSSYSMVENGGQSPAGAITSNASQRETLFTFGGGSGGGTVDFTFKAQAFAEALTTVSGETASASSNNQIILNICAAGSTESECVSPNFAGSFLPPGLQVSAASGPTTGDFTAGNQTLFNPYDSGVFNLSANTFYQFSLSSVLTETTSSVPEPMTVGLLGVGLLGLGIVRRRRMP